MTRVLAVLLLLILPPAIYFPTLGARRDEQRRHIENGLEDLDRRTEMARAAQRKLVQFRQEVSRLDEELTKLHTILPAQMSIDEIQATSASLAERNGVRLTKFEAAPRAAKPPLQRQSVRTEVIGRAEGTAEFLRDLQNAARIIDVSSVTLRKDPAGWRTDFVMTCYAMPDAGFAH